MAYTVVITYGGGSTYTFQVTPGLNPRFDFEEDGSRTPPVRTAEIETWSLKGAVYVHATQATVTTDLETLRGALAARTSPVTSVAFKRDGTTVRELITSTTHKGGVFARAFELTDSPGQLASHWKGDIVVWGRRLFGDTDSIVTERPEMDYAFDVLGRLTYTYSGELTTIPGTSAYDAATTRMETEPDSDLVSSYGLLQAERTVTVGDATDTRASWKAVWRQPAPSGGGATVPSGVSEWKETVEYEEDSDGGRRTTLTVTGRGETMSTLRSKVRARKPGSKLERLRETEDRSDGRFTGTYTTREPSQDDPDPSHDGLIFRRVNVEVQGLTAEQDERPVAAYPIPGFAPFFVARARQPITVVETVATKFRGAPAGLDAMALASRLRGQAGLLLDPEQSSQPTVALEQAGLTRDADLWTGQARYVFVATAIAAETIFSAVSTRVFG